jgi:hypothetical protein
MSIAFLPRGGTQEPARRQFHTPGPFAGQLGGKQPNYRPVLVPVDPVDVDSCLGGDRLRVQTLVCYPIGIMHYVGPFWRPERG